MFWTSISITVLYDVNPICESFLPPSVVFPEPRQVIRSPCVPSVVLMARGLLSANETDIRIEVALKVSPGYLQSDNGSAKSGERNPGP